MSSNLELLRAEYSKLNVYHSDEPFRFITKLRKNGSELVKNFDDVVHFLNQSYMYINDVIDVVEDVYEHLTEHRYPDKETIAFVEKYRSMYLSMMRNMDDYEIVSFTVLKKALIELNMQW